MAAVTDLACGAGRFLAMAAVAGGLAGCGGVTGTRGFEPESANHGTTLGNLLAFNSISAPSPVKRVEVEEKPSCPTIEVLDGTAAARTYAGAEQSNSTVRYQFSLGDVVRDCSRVGDQLVLKVGIEGRALLGPAGAPGGFTAPVRIAVRDEQTEKAVASKLYQVPVTIAGADSGAPFSIVSDPIAVPFKSAQGENDYTILVGFDPKNNGTVSGQAVGKKRRRD